MSMAPVRASCIASTGPELKATQPPAASSCESSVAAPVGSGTENVARKKSASAVKRRRPKKLVRKLVLIRWNDAWVHGAWDDESESTKRAQPIIVHTVGWVISDAPDGLLVAAQIAGIDQLANQSFIPRGMIRDVTTLKRGELTSE